MSSCRSMAWNRCRPFASTAAAARSRRAGRGSRLTVNEDPLLVLYAGGESALPEKLGEPLAKIDNPPATVKPGAVVSLAVALHGISAQDLDCVTPPFWITAKLRGSANISVAPPVGSSVREEDVTIRLHNAQGAICGELYFHAPVAR
jgi:hypothetical protein